jgi:hypothetical protein
MSKPRLPSHPQDTWAGGFIFDAAREVRSVSARAGMVVAGGPELYLLRPGEEQLKMREPPLDIGPVHLAAAEPRGSRRYAFAAQEMLAIFAHTGGEDKILRLRPPPPVPLATHLVWGGKKGPSALYVRWDDGSVVRMKPDLSDVEPLDLAPMEALAVDDAGTVAMLSLDPDPRVFVMHDHETMHFRSIEEIGEAGDIHLAVAGTAVAVSLGDGRVLVSRGENDPFTPCEALAGAGPLAFEGSSEKAALFGAMNTPSMTYLVRVDPSGAAMRIAEMGSDDGSSLEIVELSWDVTRGKLWGASPQAGLFTSVAPSAKGGKKKMLS